MWSHVAPSPPTIVNISQVTNVSAVLSIRSPFDWNGVLREYKIYYITQGEHHEHEIREQLKLSNQVKHDFLKDVSCFFSINLFTLLYEFPSNELAFVFIAFAWNYIVLGS